MEEYDDLALDQRPTRDTATPVSLLQALPYAEVAVQGSYGGDRLVTLTYEVPPNLRGRIGTGQLIWAPLRQKLTLGVIVATHDTPPTFAARPIHAPVSPNFGSRRRNWRWPSGWPSATAAPSSRPPCPAARRVPRAAASSTSPPPHAAAAERAVAESPPPADAA